MTDSSMRRGRRRSAGSLTNPAIRERMDPEFLIYSDLTRKYWMSRKIAGQREQGWKLTREQYIEFWMTDNREQRRAIENLVMARVDKTGAWAWDNIECITRAADLKIRGDSFHGAERAQRAVWVGEAKFQGLRVAARCFGIAPSLARYRCKVQARTAEGLWRYDDDI